MTYCFNVPQSGNYQIQGLVWPTSSGNTFWVQVLGQNYLWDLPSQNNTYALDTVNNRNAGGADVTLTLPAGEVTVIVRLREDGARLDTIGLVPAGGAGNSINPLNTTPAFDAPAIPRTSPFSR